MQELGRNVGKNKNMTLDSAWVDLKHIKEEGLRGNVALVRRLNSPL